MPKNKIQRYQTITREVFEKYYQAFFKEMLDYLKRLNAEDFLDTHETAQPEYQLREGMMQD